MLRFPSYLIALSAAYAACAPAAAQEFSGPRVEALGGWSDGERASGLPTRRDDGFVYGVGAGYDVRLGRFSLGVSGEVSDVTGRSCQLVSLSGLPSGSPAVLGSSCEKEGRTLFGGVRAGYVLGERTLLYVTGGYANSRRSTRFSGTIDGTPRTGSDSFNLDGVRGGAGVERLVSGNVSLKAEYRYTAVGHDLATDQHQLVAGIGFHF